MVKHLSEFAPEHTRVLGEPATAAIVRTGIARAEDYGFVTEGPVRLYIEMMFLLGSGFDTDPLFPRVSEILTSQDGETERARALYEWITVYSRAVFGTNGKLMRAALRRAAAVTPASARKQALVMQH